MIKKMSKPATIKEILEWVKDGSMYVEDAESQIKTIIGVIVDNAAIGIGNLDATEMYGEINRELDKI